MLNNVQTQAMAESCAKKIPVGSFGILGIIEMLKIIQIGYEAWKGCSKAAYPEFGEDALARASKDEIEEGREPDGEFSPKFMERAARHVRRAARANCTHMSREDSFKLAKTMLEHVLEADQASIAACYQESPEEALAALERFPDVEE